MTLSWLTAAAPSTPLVALVPMHATPGDQPPPLTPVRLLTAWTWDWFLGIAIVVTAALYIWGVVRLRQRGDRWPVGRSVAFLLGGLGSMVVATMSALGTYDTVLLSIHMVQHMILAMMTPLFLGLGAPVTLALRTLPLRPRKWLLALVHSRLAKVLTFPPLSLAIFIANPFVLYYTGLYPITLESPFWHNVLHLHFVVSSSLFLVPMVGVDPVPGRVTYPLRMLMLFLTLPFHAFLGVTIMSSEVLIAEEWYVSFGRTWGHSPLDDQYLAGGILWGSGDLIALMFFGALFVQWFRSSQREAVREDRRLDMLEAQEARRLATEDAAEPDTSTPDTTTPDTTTPDTTTPDTTTPDSTTGAQASRYDQGAADGPIVSKLD